MKNIFKHKILVVGLFSLLSLSCGDLELEPYNEITSNKIYADFGNYKGVLAKLYAGYAMSGQQGGDGGDPDISGLDEGFSNYLRLYFNLQELTTDESVIGWTDGTLPDLVEMDWGAGNEYIGTMYSRIYYQIALTNEFIRETSDDKLNSRGLTEAQIAEAQTFRAEARFLRALSYWHALDMFGNVPFVTEQDEVGSYFPEQIFRPELFSYIETELLDIEDKLAAPKQNEYARADQAAVWTLLTKLYLNAQVYIQEDKNTEAITYAKKVIDANYPLDADYSHLFLADNHTASGIIFPIAFDGTHTQSYGGTAYLILGSIGGSMNPADFGMSSGWNGMRTTKNIVNLYADPYGNIDKRAMFYTDGQNLEIEKLSTFTDGYPITKYKNISSIGVVGSDPTGTFPDTDFPMFRIADVYLMYAEAVLRGGAGGNLGTALTYVNMIRERAYGGTDGDISAATLTLDFILDERARELSYEMHRRTDLIRFGKFTGGEYLWPWKGGTMDGKSVSTHRDLFPIPSSDRLANPNLKQNDGY
ncbi:RagB/SusD family nutrient uptake outer membrane protein [Fulvivirga ligni]|uniref:RagB/SusD family nutrient uptake outer membrane protein n=1 Tax=Fulvivirga ligni TaxID=2904246 RepID=UPI001F2A9755|nr:RagB/SusD family nutrient uptake outer membrane protein [Fulvivirga ligni]UII19348.1 RagB/SusD family nutrient uptake outer membrane protein [Fulvivirga ligni]